MRSVLSRVRQFLFWTLLLLLGAYIAWGRIEAWRLSRAVDAIQARGEPVDYDYWYAKQVTAEQKEAATLYARAADYSREAESGQQYRASQIDVDLPSGPVLTLADVAAIYRPDAPAMQLLDRVTPMDFTEFGEDSRELYDNQIPLQVLGAQACLRADLIAARSGDGNAAAAALIPCVRLQRTLLNPMYRGQHGARLLGSFRVVFRHTTPSDASLASLQSAFAGWPEEEVVIRAVMQNRARLLSNLDAPSRSLGEAVTSALSQPFLTNFTRQQLASYDELLALARMTARERRDALAARPRAAVSTRRGFLGRFTSRGWYATVWYESARFDLAVRQIMTTVLAVERYRRAHQGAVPPSLDALVPAFLSAVSLDPLSEGAGQPLNYRSDADGYVIYSIDSNRRDDGGAFYGHGAAVTKHVGPQSPRDLGIRVPLKPIK